MFAYLKILPILLLLAGAGYAAHWFIVNQLNTQIVQLQSDVRQYQAQNVALQSAAEINEQTIRSLEENSQRQIQQVTALTSVNQQLQTEKDEYLSIFRRHDLQRLALARPGLIEPRINNGTQEVFRQMEQDSREVSILNE
jgi:predicted PurR-regulated permease PerM